MAQVFYKLKKEDGDYLRLETGDFILLDNFFSDNQTKSLKYTVKISLTITKSLKYAVRRTPSTLTKSLKYTVKAPLTITKSLKYTVKTTPSTITKSLKYTVRITPSTITKSLNYEVRKAITITKSLKYTTKISVSAITKSLKYAILTTPTTITKSLKYTVIKGIAITKSLKYTILTTPTTITKSLQYESVKRYSREQLNDIVVDDSDLAILFSNAEIADTEADDDQYVDLVAEGVGNYAVQLFKFNHFDNNTDQITVTWKGKTTLAPSTSTVVLQIFNFNSGLWETLDSDNATAEDTEFILTGTISVDMANYYTGTMQKVVARVYQLNA